MELLKHNLLHPDYIVTFIGILICIFEITCMTIARKRNKNNSSKDKIKDKYKKEIEELKKKKEQSENELLQDLITKKEELQRSLNELSSLKVKNEEQYQQSIENLKNDYNKRKLELQQLDKQNEQKRLLDNQDKIQKEQAEYNKKLNELTNNYNKKKEEINNDFNLFTNEINVKKEQLNQEILSYEKQQEEIIKRFKIDEERQQQQNFYKISINELEESDVKKLKSLSVSLSKPEILLKLIYECYYKQRLEEVFKRVLGENKDKGGIYKITNITNEKVYVGRCQHFIDRWRTHAKRGCGIERINGQLYDAMFEEGLQNFTWEVIEVCSKEEQSEKEKYWINFYHSDEYGYNIKKGG